MKKKTFCKIPITDGHVYGFFFFFAISILERCLEEQNFHPFEDSLLTAALQVRTHKHSDGLRNMLNWQNLIKPCTQIFICSGVCLGKVGVLCLAVTLQMWVRILFFCVQANDLCPQFQAFEAMPGLRPQARSHTHTWMSFSREAKGSHRHPSEWQRAQQRVLVTGCKLSLGPAYPRSGLETLSQPPSLGTVHHSQ